MPFPFSFTRRRRGLMVTAFAAVGLVGCAPPPRPVGDATPVYSKTTGKLEQLVSDRNHDGKAEARAYMDGATLQRIELDRDSDGKPDRWEYYAPPAAAAGGPSMTGAVPDIVKAEESNGSDGRITRREIYRAGRLAAVEEDVDGDGRIDKWETYADGELRQVDLDVDGSGIPGQRLSYHVDGSVTTAALPKGAGR